MDAIVWPRALTRAKCPASHGTHVAWHSKTGARGTEGTLSCDTQHMCTGRRSQRFCRVFGNPLFTCCFPYCVAAWRCVAGELVALMPSIARLDAPAPVVEELVTLTPQVAELVAVAPLVEELVAMAP